MTGEKFMDVVGASDLTCSRHALERLREIAGVYPTDEWLTETFLGSRYTKPSEIHALGYRPRYEGRKQRGIDSWYFRTEVRGVEIVIVVTRSLLGGGLLWVTTYGQSRQYAA